MKRVVYIGGFGCGEWGAARVASALNVYYEQVDTFTFYRAMNNPDRVRDAVQGVDVVTHSAGMIAIEGTSPRRIIAFGAPLPMQMHNFAKKTVHKRYRMHTQNAGILSPQDVPIVRKFETSSLAELASHPIGNLGQIRRISRFDAVDTAITAKQKNIPTSLVYTEGDEFFYLSERNETVASAAGVTIIRLPGVHDELILRPAETLRQINFTSL